MPPYYFRRRRWPRQRKRYRRNWRGYWRPRRTFQRNRRTTWVRRKLFRRFKRKKLKNIKIIQWQPQKIRKCHIKGFLELFETSRGRVSNNFTATKESYVPEHEPGGGGWGIQQLSLGNLYVQNLYCMNYWTKSNVGYNLCRYFGVRLNLYRQRNVDWIFSYNLEEPLTITKYTYASYHPYKMFQYKKKILIPSLETAPLKRKLYIKKYIKPPKKLTNQWYFQNHLQNTPLLTFYASACNLQTMFISHNAKNNNVTLTSLNTRFFEHPIFQYLQQSTTGFHPDKAGKTYMYALQHASPNPSDQKISELTFLGNTHYYDDGQPIGTSSSITDYNKDKWGNPFFTSYLNQDDVIFITSTENYTLTNAITDKDSKISSKSQFATKFDPLIYNIRYNPNKDKGVGNIAYFKTTYDISQKNWDPPDDEDLIIRNFPLWLMLWGFEDYILKLGYISKLYENGILVIQSDYFSEKLPYYVFISENFKYGQGPYDVPTTEMSTYTRSHWYPCWQYQKQAIENLLMTGPGVAKPFISESIQAHFKYDFFFKWGGNPSTFERIHDPNSQPVGPDPNSQLLNTEIISPATSIQDFIYNWETRRDTLTQAATERIKQIPTNVYNLFTDGTTTSTDIQTFQKAPQEKATQEKEKETLLQQLNLVQQYNNQLYQRLRQLTIQIENVP